MTVADTKWVALTTHKILNAYRITKNLSFLRLYPLIEKVLDLTEIT